MQSLRRQRTLRAPVQVQGFGYWSGRDVCVKFHPAAAGSGVVFVRDDLANAKAIPALVDFRQDVPRRTNLVSGKTHASMVEHVLAALAGLQIDNCAVHVDSEEMPGMDGSSLAFTEALLAAGIEEQDQARLQLVIDQPCRVEQGDAWIEARPSLAGEFRLEYQLDYGAESPIPQQSLSLTVDPEVFRTELAATRTFLLKSEATRMLARGLGTRVSHRDLLVFDVAGVVDNELRFEDECVRHKMLDMVGDLALAGCDLVGEFVACRSGHSLNAQLVKRLVAHAEMGQQLRQSA